MKPDKIVGPIEWWDDNSACIKGDYGQPITVDEKSGPALRDALLEVYPLALALPDYDRGFEDGYELGSNPPELGPDDMYISPYCENMTFTDQSVSVPEPWTLVSLDPRGAGHTYRHRVPGGWLYRTVTYRYPELHQRLENGDLALPPFATGPKGCFTNLGYENYRDWTHAQEILTQTTCFVPEA